MNEEQRWQAVLNRNQAMDGEFVYAVRSTGIYCRPSCPSRRPGRAQVQFFTVPALAEAAGFRACQRCRPGQSELPDPRVAVVQRICQVIDASDEARPTLEALAAQVHLSPFHLQRTFKAVMGITPRQYAEARRLERLKTHLREGEGVSEALYAAGYGSSSRLYEAAPGNLGMTPATYRKGGSGMELSFTIAASPLGRLLAAGTERGLSAVYLGDHDATLEAELRHEFPQAQISRDDSALGPWVDTIVRHLAGEQPHLELPLDVRATAFQRQVWQALRNIPYGETRTYGQIAHGLGNPGAARAVGRACATNPVSLVIPCHRAVGEDGGLHGYRWGVARKQSLLALEKQRVGEELSVESGG